MAEKNWMKLFTDHKGQWVALKDNEVTVISSGDKLPDVLRQAIEKGFSKPIITKVPEKDIMYIGSL